MAAPIAPVSVKQCLLKQWTLIPQGRPAGNQLVEIAFLDVESEALKGCVQD